MAHAKFSASGSDRWLNCPGSIRLAEVLPKSKSSVYALEGTAAHALGEACLRQGSSSSRWAKGQYIDVTEDKAKFLTASKPLTNPPPEIVLVTDDMIEAVDAYLDVVADIKAELGEHIETRIEARLDLSWIRPNMFGTADYVAAKWMDTLVVIDYKHGKGVRVNAVNNSQLKYYALGAAKEFDFEFEKVIMIVVQPRIYSSEGPAQRHEITMDELRRFEKELAEGYDRAQEEDSMLNPGDWCKFCPALGVPPGQLGHCAPSWKKAEEVAMADFANAPALVDQEELPVPSTPEQLSKALQWIPFIDNWCKRVAAEAENQALTGVEIPGFKLVEKRTNRKWSDFALEEEIVKEIKTGFGLTDEDLYEPPKLKTPPKIEKLLKAAQKRELAATGLVVKPQGALTLVSQADNREAKIPQLAAASDFENAPDT